MKRVILVILGAFALGYWSEVFAESFGCPRRYSSHNPMSATSFAKTYGGTDDDYASSVQQTSDGGYIVAGETYSFGAGWYDIFLIKTDASGNVQWAKTYGGTDTENAYPFNRHPTVDISWRVIRLPSVRAGEIFSSSRLMRTETYNGLKLTEERAPIGLLPFNRHQTADTSWRVIHNPSVRAVMIFSSLRLMRAET